MTSSIRAYSSSEYDYSAYQTDKLENTTTALEVQGKAQLGDQTIEAAEERIDLALREKRYDDIPYLVDELLTLYTELFTEELAGRDVNPEGLELVYSIFETFHSVSKTFSLVMTHKPEEAIAIASQAIQKIRAHDLDFSHITELERVNQSLFQLRSAAYLYIDQKELAIDDLKSSLTNDALNILFIRTLEQKLDCSFLPTFEVTQAEFEEMDTPEKIEFSLMNGNPYRALELLESEKLSGNYSDSFLELKALALSLSGSCNEALENYELLRSHSDKANLDPQVLELILFMKGDIQAALATCLTNGNFTILPLMQYFL